MKLVKKLFLLTLVSTVSCFTLDAAQRLKKRKTNEQEHQCRNKKARIDNSYSSFLQSEQPQKDEKVRYGCIGKVLNTFLSLIPKKKNGEKFKEEAKQALDSPRLTDFPDDMLINILSFIEEKNAISILSLVNRNFNRLVPVAVISLNLDSPQNRYGYKLGKEDIKDLHTAEDLRNRAHEEIKKFTVFRNVSQVSSKTLSKYTKLQKLYLPKHTNDTDIITIVSSSQDLQHLSLLNTTNFLYSINTLTAISSLQHLTSLELPYTQINQGEWKHLTPCLARGKMESLVLPGNQILDADLESWALYLSNLRHLNVRFCLSITRAGLQKLFLHLKNIKCLQLGGCWKLGEEYQKTLVEEGYESFIAKDCGPRAPLEELRNLLKEAAQSSS